MGGLVPYGQVWRTGANAATTLVTPRDLRIGDTPVPAGTYTLYTLPGESEWQLIINRQTGQWGTEYDQAQDLARIPMQRGAHGRAGGAVHHRPGPGGGRRAPGDGVGEHARRPCPCRSSPRRAQ